MPYLHAYDKEYEKRWISQGSLTKLTNLDKSWTRTSFGMEENLGKAPRRSLGINVIEHYTKTFFSSCFLTRISCLFSVSSPMTQLEEFNSILLSFYHPKTPRDFPFVLHSWSWIFWSRILKRNIERHKKYY